MSQSAEKGPDKRHNRPLNPDSLNQTDLVILPQM